MTQNPQTWEWLKSTEKLQLESYGNDLRAVSGAEQDRKLLDNHAGIIWELTEAMDETSAKPWSSETGVINREKYLGELVDVGHFLANLILIGDFTEEEYWTAYRGKQDRNRARMAKAGGYHARENRCPNCRRELDAPGAYEWLTQEYIQPEDATEFMKNELKCSACQHKFVLQLPVGQLPPGLTKGKGPF